VISHCVLKVVFLRDAVGVTRIGCVVFGLAGCGIGNPFGLVLTEIPVMRTRPEIAS
jgi:hypothetical protein